MSADSLTRRALVAGAASIAALGARAAPEPPTLFVSHPATLAHDPGPGHPDTPERLRALLAALDAPGFSALSRREAPRATRDHLLRIHGEEMIAHIEKTSPREGFGDAAKQLNRSLEPGEPGGSRSNGGVAGPRASRSQNAIDPELTRLFRRVALARLDGDTVMGPGTLEAALRAAGGAIAAAGAVMRRDAKNAFVATRPPGHHAGENAAMGFCIFNNAAIAARYAMNAHGAGRVAIVDFDAHHGNGVQDIFWNEKNVLYCSTHQMPLYPGTGAVTETGAHDNIVNAPLAKGDGGKAFREALETRILRRVEAFAPDLVIICAGFDAHLHDPLSGLRFAEEDYRDVTLRVMEIAARRCNGRILSLLEGGYRPADLARSAAAHIGALMQA